MNCNYYIRLCIQVTCLILAAMVNATSAFASHVVISNVTIISAERDMPLLHANVEILDNEIIQVSSKAIQTSSLTTVIDGSGKYLIPGLMDSHVHVGTMPGIIDSDKLPSRFARLQQDFIKQQPKSYLYFGVTQLLDLSQSTQSLLPFTQQPQRPDIFHCGAIRVLNGYGTAGMSAQQAISQYDHIIFDAPNGLPAPKGIDLNKHTAEYLVKQIANDGAICLKVFLEDGFGMSSHWPIMNNALLQQIKTEAIKHKLILVAHANAIDMQPIALENNIDVIAHGLWNWNEFDGQQGLPKEIKVHLDNIVKNKVVFQATFDVMDGLAGIMADDPLANALYKKVITPSALSWYQSEEALWFKYELSKDFDGLPSDKIATIFKAKGNQNERVLKYLSGLDYPLVLASDTPSSPTMSAQPGFSSHNEILHLHRAGVSLKQIFAAATINNAAAFGLLDLYGTIEPGKVANLLLLSKNPLETIEAYNAIDKIILQGDIIEREALAALNK